MYTYFKFATPHFIAFSGPGGIVGIAGQSRDRILVGARFPAPVQTGLGTHPASCTMSIGSFPGVKSGRGMTLTPHPLLVPWTWKSRAIPLLPLWAVRPVQSLSACTRVTFTFFLKLFLFRRQWIHKNWNVSEPSCNIKLLRCLLSDIMYYIG
jgi:hypothetical protein